MSFEAPLFLALLGLALPVVVAFLVKRRHPTLVVPSTLRWRMLSVARHRSRRLRNLRRWLALAACLGALAALALASARPLGEGAGETLYVVVDVSPSMGDAQRGPLSDAIARVRGIASSMGARDRVALIAAGPTPERLLAPTRDAAQVRAAA
ncbi:MAG: VWA domain-containing protein, partial [Myxococcales bacterium]|nr:VWA domain-containing protein [Myxococcales bacterium]